MVSAVAVWVMVQPLATFAATTVTGGAALAPSRAAVLTMVSRSMSIPETDQGQAGRLGRFGQLDGQAGGQMGAVGRQARGALQRGFHHAARGAQLAHAQLVQRFVFTGNGQHQARSLCAGSAGAAARAGGGIAWSGAGKGMARLTEAPRGAAPRGLFLGPPPFGGAARPGNPQAP